MTISYRNSDSYFTCGSVTGPADDEILVKEKGGYVMLGSERPTPTSSIGSSHTKGMSVTATHPLTSLGADVSAATYIS